MEKFKTSWVFFTIAFLSLASFVFYGGVLQTQFTGNIGGEKGVSVEVNDISDITAIILFAIFVLAILIGFIIKLKFENKRK